MTSIGEQAFYYCNNLTNILISNSVISIESEAFAYCTSLTSIYFQGDAPSSTANAFECADSPTLYYLPGTTGWGLSLSGRPTVLWNPQVQTSNTSFGVHNNQFDFTMTGTTNLVVVVEACTNLANPTWGPVATNTLTGGSSYFNDPQWMNYSRRFYRLRSP